MIERDQATLTIIKIALTIASIAVGNSSFAQANLRGGYPNTVEEYDSREVAMLPLFCIYAQGFRESVPGGNNQRTIEQWYARLGPGFHHVHHYCWGLMKMNRANFLTRDEATRRHYLRDSVREFDYVILRVPSDFVLMPEILSKKAHNLIRLGESAKALEHLEHAIELKPDYWPPYAHIADHYKSTGDLKAAREWLEKGLARSPDAKGLKMRLSELLAIEKGAATGVHNR